MDLSKESKTRSNIISAAITADVILDVFVLGVAARKLTRKTNLRRVLFFTGSALLFASKFLKDE